CTTILSADFGVEAGCDHHQDWTWSTTSLTDLPEEDGIRRPMPAAGCVDVADAEARALGPRRHLAARLPDPGWPPHREPPESHCAGAGGWGGGAGAFCGGGCRVLRGWCG